MNRGSKEFSLKNEAELLDILKELCLIPAPSGLEDERAAYCKERLEAYGARGVYIDEAKNVVYPINAEESDRLTVIVAHTDTVFPDTEPMPYKDDGETVFCPGVGDDTSSVAVLLLLAKYLIENNIKPENGLLLVCNSCEEGLGNLKGTRKIFEDYAGRIEKFVSFDSNINKMYTRCVGSTRYEVEVTTEGGHSYGAFGNKNAIYYISKIISAIYSIKVPEIEGEKTTYNVGVIEGGTSINTIAQSAKILCEYRSTSSEAMDIMKEKFLSIFDSVREDGVGVGVTVVGERPSAKGVDPESLNALISTCEEAVRRVTGEGSVKSSASTDCNIPLSLGIPSVCFGVSTSYGAHTREERLTKSSMKVGLEIAIETTLDLI